MKGRRSARSGRTMGHMRTMRGREGAEVVDLAEARVRRGNKRIGPATARSGCSRFVQEMVRSSLVSVGFSEAYAERASADLARDWELDAESPSWRTK